jgi:hypothetical protein
MPRGTPTTELALRLIEENKGTKSPVLDLGDCGLTQFPPELAELSWLETLVLAPVWEEPTSRLGSWREQSRNTGRMNVFGGKQAPLAPLPLKKLFLDGTHLTDLAPLSVLGELETLSLGHNPVEDLSPLGNLTRLRELRLSSTNVADLSPLTRLTDLRVLFATNTNVVDLSPLTNLGELEVLHITGTQVEDLAPLHGTTSLQLLHANSCRVADLTPLANLTHLRRLLLEDTAVADLSPLLHLIRSGCPVQWSDESFPKPGIYVGNCPLADPPVEIVQQGNAAILNYFDERKGGVDHLYEAKMLILGKGGAGKTSLLRRLYYPDLPLPEPQETTKGIDIHRQDFLLANGKQFRLNVWDFGGQEIYQATHQFFLTKRSIYALVDDTKDDSKSVSDEGFKYWLDLVEVFGGGSPVLIFQNEKGGRSKPIGLEGIQARYPNVKRRYAGNLENPNSADAMREGVVRFASSLEHIGEEMPAKWLQVRADIEARASETPYIFQEEYFRIYSRHLDPDRAKALFLSRYLHDLGVFLHFQDDPLLARTIVLQNQWATQAVFKMLDDETVKGYGGRFDESDCKRIWSTSAYADMHPELLALMKNFELCYELRDSRPAAWVAPQLFSPNRPPRFLNWAKSSDLVLRYKYTFLPKGILSRLTVRLHRFLSGADNAWRTGAHFEREATEVLVELLPEGSEIELRARGPEAKELLSVVSSDLDALNDAFEGLKDRVDKLIPCICPTCATGPKPHFFEQKDLLRRREKVNVPRSARTATMP